ncbi:MAG: hypothetical protein QOH04_2419 [Sphingomonadales bacterium]|nr:hypothetical protein [Sphingomonadales bacterium]
MKIDIYLGERGGPHDYMSEYVVSAIPRIGEHLTFNDAEDPEHLYEVWEVHHRFAGEEIPPEVRVYVSF